MTLLAAAAQQAAAAGGGGGGFDLENDISWYSLWWAEGTNFGANSYTNGSAVTDWQDESATGNDFDQSQSANRPTYTASSINSQPAVVFSQDDFMRIATGYDTVGISQPFSVITVLRWDGPAPTFTADAGILEPSESLESPRYILWFDEGNNDIGVFAGSAVYAGHTVDGDAILITNVVGSSDDLQVDGTSLSTSNTGANSFKFDADGTQGAVLGARERTDDGTAGGGRSFLGAIAFVGVYDGDITSDGEFANLESWVSSHYGITIA